MLKGCFLFGVVTMTEVESSKQELIKKETFDGLKMEYAEISRNYLETAKFRLSIPGFYIVAAGLLLREGTGRTLFLLAIITVVVWLMEWRNREVLWMLRRRGHYIERYWWIERDLLNENKQSPNWRRPLKYQK